MAAPTASADETRAPGLIALDWMDALKALAILGVLWNHLVEEFASGPWFTNPSEGWPDLSTRMGQIFPHSSSPLLSVLTYLGWLGDSAPGVFILTSGLGLTWGALQKSEGAIAPLQFYRRRLIRLLPLYWAMHFVVLAAPLLIRGSTATFASPRVLLSLLGLRVTDGLFFYLNPSWWFIWLILQLYLLFPFLYRALHRLGLPRFVLLTWGVTFAVRALALAGVRTGGLYYWMTGLCCGTRLAEFTTGMALAAWIWRRRTEAVPLPTPGRIALSSGALYLTGLVSSFTLPGSVVANLLVTLGLCGLFYVVWERLLRRSARAARLTLSLGSGSYGLYLLHQAPLQWTGALLSKKPMLHLAAALVALLLSIPATRLIERAVDWLGSRALSSRPARLLPAAALLFVALLYLRFDPAELAPRAYRLFAYALGLCLSCALLLERRPVRERRFLVLARWTLAAVALLQLFVLPPQSGRLALVLGLCSALVAHAISRLCSRRAVIWPLSAGIVGGGLLLLEVVLLRVHPLETDRWGELPALEIHARRGYALKPRKETLLRYNHYRYLLRTNSLGLASPEIPLTRPTPDTLRVLVLGDAFSMPEGLEHRDSFPALLERRLSERLRPRRVQVINGGVTGYGPNESLAELADLAPRLRPEVILYELFINELEEVALTPEDRRADIGLAPRGGPLQDRIYSRSQIAAHWQILAERLNEALSGRPGPWRERRALLGFYRTGPSPYYTPERLGQLSRALSRMKTLAEENRARLVLLYAPGAIEVSPRQHLEYYPGDAALTDPTRFDLDRPFSAMRSIAGALALPLVDLRQPLRSHPQQPVYFPYAWHWNADGHRAVAEALVPLLLRLGPVPDRPRP